MPLRFPRPVMALIATGVATVSIGLSALPASADQVRNQEWWLSSLHISAAWTTSQGAGVTVAVLSDGVNASVADLAGAVTTAPATPGAPTASGRYAGEQGTPTASLIAGRGHGPGRSAGVIGVAPKARILSIPVTLPADDPLLAQSSAAAAIPDAIAAGIRYAVKHGARVIDLPIDPGQAGSNGTGGVAAAAGGSAAERAAVGYALANNVVLVAPAGDNEAAGDAANYPAAYSGVIAVGAFDSGFNKAAWSSHQSYVTLAAAGAGVIAANNAGGYTTMNSTTAASAEVSGVVALIRSRYPGLTVAEVRQALITTSTYRRSGGLAIGSGYGAVNARQAMTAAARLAGPSAPRAAAGALARNAPAPPAPASGQGFGAQMLRATEVSAGLLIVLLLLIAAYAAIGRRRHRDEPAIATEWMHRPGQSRYPQAGSDADRMLELFAAPALPPPPTALQGGAGVRGGRYGSKPAGGGVFAPVTGRDATRSSGHQAGEPGADEPATGEAAASSGWLSHGPASRAVDRHASVSGAPPWEPAAAPAGELPWATAPGRHGGPPVAGRSAQQAPTYSGDPDYDPAGPVSRAGQFDAEPAVGGYSSPDRGGAPGGYRSPPEAGVPSGPPAVGDYRSPTGSGAPSGAHSRPRYGPPVDPTSPVGYGSDSADPRGAPSGLPMRQPRVGRPSDPGQRSPSGSLWEPASRETSLTGDPAEYRDQGYDAAGRPIFAWDADWPQTDPGE